MRSNTVEKILKTMTPEKMEELKLKRIGRVKKLSSQYQLGLFVGHYLTNKIPSLSTDMPRYKTVIEVSTEDTIKEAELDKTWFNLKKGIDRDNAWDEYRNFNKYLEDKYLPKEVKIHLEALNITNMKEFKEGIRTTLWNSDCCSYSLDLDDIQVDMDEDYHFTAIKLIYEKTK